MAYKKEFHKRVMKFWGWHTERIRMAAFSNGIYLEFTDWKLRIGNYRFKGADIYEAAAGIFKEL